MRGRWMCSRLSSRAPGPALALQLTAHPRHRGPRPGWDARPAAGSWPCSASSARVLSSRKACCVHHLQHRDLARARIRRRSPGPPAASRTPGMRGSPSHPDGARRRQPGRPGHSGGQAARSCGSTCSNNTEANSPSIPAPPVAATIAGRGGGVMRGKSEERRTASRRLRPRLQRGVRRFLRQGCGRCRRGWVPVRVPAGEFCPIRRLGRMRRAIGIAFEGDARHRDGGREREPPFQIVECRSPSARPSLHR